MDKNRSFIWGFLLLVIGLLFLSRNMGWILFEWRTMWPWTVIGAGILLWIWWIMERRDEAVLMLGTIFVVYGLLFLYCVYFGWESMGRLWPVFIIGPGLGSLAVYIFGERERGALLTGLVLMGMGLVFFTNIYHLNIFWPILLIALGVYLMFKASRPAVEDPSASHETDRKNRPSGKV